MPEMKKNALADLAEWLKKQEGSFPVLANQFLYEDERDMHNISKVQRIIAELAKVIDCKEPERIMPLDKPYDDIVLYAPYDNGMTESNSIDEDEKRFIFDLANSAWKCREIAEE